MRQEHWKLVWPLPFLLLLLTSFLFYQLTFFKKKAYTSACIPVTVSKCTCLQAWLASTAFLSKPMCMLHFWINWKFENKWEERQKRKRQTDRRIRIKLKVSNILRNKKCVTQMSTWHKSNEGMNKHLNLHELENWLHRGTKELLLLLAASTQTHWIWVNVSERRKMMKN